VRLLLSHARSKRMDGRLMMVFDEMSIRPFRNNRTLFADQWLGHFLSGSNPSMGWVYFVATV
jgi:hypothetical protein